MKSLYALRMDGQIDFRGELNDEQYAAVTAPRGPALVLAGAGSGKTRTLTYRVAWLRAQNIKHWQMLLLTFTNKAAREMIERVEKLTGDEFPPVWGGTFHSIGARVLRREGKAVGLEPSFTIMDEGDAESLFSETAKGVNKAFFRDKENPKPKVLLNWLSYSRNTQKSISSVVNERYPDGGHVADALVDFAEAYQKKKRASQVTDYDDLLTLWLEVLQKDDSALKRYQKQFEHILVDEYQDTNAIQSAIVDLIASEHQIMAVGDDAQCIYTWRGAEFDNILHFPDRHPGTKIYQILNNYRSTQPILNLANDILREQAISGAGYEKSLKAIRKGSLKPRVIPCADAVSQARFVIDRAIALNEEGISFGEIAVLYRAHYQALDLQLELSRRHLPFTITSGVRFFEQAHIRDVIAQLRLISNPGDEPAFVRICELLPKIGPKTASRLHGIANTLFEKRTGKVVPVPQQHDLSLFDMPEAKSVAEVEKVATTATHPIEIYDDPAFIEKVPEAARDTWRDLALTLKQALQAHQEKPEEPAKAVEILVEGWYGDYIKTAYDRGENRREDLNALIDFAGKFDSMSEMLAQLVLLSSEGAEKSAETDSREKLRLSTIHQAKGLEFPVVFLIGASEGSLPLKRAIDDGDVDEERRLFYVAVTRAEDELYICYPMMQVQRGGGVFHLDESQFISEISPENYESARPRRSW
jgi:DNA helicase II / ATP-dependent DNA helicase PcrA